MGRQEVNDPELLRAMTLFVSAIRRSTETRYVWYDKHTIVMACAENSEKVDDVDPACHPLQALVNLAHTHNYEYAASTLSHEMSIALVAGLISRECPTYTHFIVRISPRLANKYLSGPDERELALKIVKRYFEEIKTR